MRTEKVAILLLDSWSRDFCRGMIITIPKEKLKYGGTTRLASFSHVAYEGKIDEHFKVLDFISDPDNISNHDVEFTRMMYPEMEVIYERAV